jgi:tRNA(adenine34) deaminase
MVTARGGDAGCGGPGGDAWVDAMEAALEEARRAASLHEVPVGAVVLLEDRVVARGHNRTLGDGDPTAHAEIVALRHAAREAGNHRLAGAVLVVTLEPCLMCCGAAVQARIARIVWAADDPKAGATGVLRAVTEAGQVNHRVELERGPGGDEAGRLLRAFFRARR